MQPALWCASGWPAFLTIHCFLHPLGQFLGVFFFQTELSAQDHELVQAAVPVGKHQIVTAARNDFATAGHHVGRAGPLTDVAAIAAGVAVQRAADGAGNANQRFQSPQASADGGGNDVPQSRAAASRGDVLCDLNLIEDAR